MLKMGSRMRVSRGRNRTGRAPGLGYQRRSSGEKIRQRGNRLLPLNDQLGRMKVMQRRRGAVGSTKRSGNGTGRPGHAAVSKHEGRGLLRTQDLNDKHHEIQPSDATPQRSGMSCVICSISR